MAAYGQHTWYLKKVRDMFKSHSLHTNKNPGRRRDDRRILVLVGVDLELDVDLSLELIWIWIGSGLTRTHPMQFVFFLWVQLR